MKGNAMKVNHMNALLVEIMMAVLFFALSATVILELFMAGHGLSTQAEIIGAATQQAQYLCEEIYAADDVQAMLADRGFEAQSTGWHKCCGDYVLLVKQNRQSLPAGEIITAEITAVQDEDIIVTLPCTRYVSGEVAQ